MIPERIWSHVEKTAGCWLWRGAIGGKGYGSVWFSGKQRLAHRVFYGMLRGPIPAGLCLDHLCRVRNCVNPDHLEPVTIRENSLRGETTTARNAAVTHCPRGHPYDDANTYRRPNGSRDCRTCGREAAARHAAKNKQQRAHQSNPTLSHE